MHVADDDFAEATIKAHSNPVFSMFATQLAGPTV